MKKFLWLIGFSFLLYGCATLFPTLFPGKVIDMANLLEVKKIAIVPGKTIYPEIQNIGLDQFEKQIIQSKIFDNVIDSNSVKKKFNGKMPEIVVPQKPFLFDVNPQLLDCDPKVISNLNEKVNVDAYIIFWVFKWRGSEYKPLTASGIASELILEKSNQEGVVRDIVVQMFNSNTGKEIWQGHLFKNENVTPKMISNNDLIKKMEQSEIIKYANTLAKSLIGSRLKK